MLAEESGYLSRLTHTALVADVLWPCRGREFKAAMRALGFPIKKVDVIKYFKEIPKDISDSLTFEEFVRIVGPIMPKRDSKEEIYKVF